MLQTSRVASGFDVELQLGRQWFITAINLLIDEGVISVPGLPIIIKDVQISFEPGFDLQIDVVGLDNPVLAKATLNEGGTKITLTFNIPLIPAQEIPFGALSNLSGIPALVKLPGDADHEPVLAVLANMRLQTNDQSDEPVADDELDQQVRGNAADAISFLPKNNHIAFGMGKATYQRFANNIWHTELRNKDDGTHPLPDASDPKGSWNKVSMRGAGGKIIIKLEGEVPIDIWPDADVTITLTITPSINDGKLSFSIASDTDVDTGILGDIFAFFAGGLGGGIVGFLIGLLTGGVLTGLIIGAAIGAVLAVIVLEIVEVVVEGIVQKKIQAKINGEPVDDLHCNKSGIVQIATPSSDGFNLAVLDGIPSSIAIHTDNPRDEILYKASLLVTSVYDELAADGNGFAITGITGTAIKFQPEIVSIRSVSYLDEELLSLIYRRQRDGKEQILTKAEVLNRAEEGELKAPFKLFEKPEKSTLRIPEGKLACVCLKPIAIKQDDTIVEEIEFENGLRIKVPDAIALQDAGALVVQGYQLIHPRDYNSYYRAKADFFKDNNFESLPKLAN